MFILITSLHQIYDIQTGQVTLTLNNPDLANNYKRNCATFNPTDDLVLNDGVLWDVRTAQAIHKFDKFNMNISGVFHPNGLEVIINTEIVSFHCWVGTTAVLELLQYGKLVILIFRPFYTSHYCSPTVRGIFLRMRIFKYLFGKILVLMSLMETQKCYPFLMNHFNGEIK